MTLALAALDIVRVPGGIVEPLIAASIVYVGLQNLLRPEPLAAGARWKVTFAFGLIHGFGFAGALRDLDIGTSAATMALPLASFNLGVEAGQMTVAAMLVPLFWAARARPGLRQLATGWSILVTAAGAYWLVQRML